MKRNQKFVEKVRVGRAKHAAVVVLIVCLMLVLTSLVGASAAIAADSPMLHNSNRFPGTTKHGGAWGLPSTKYGEFQCGTCHARNTGNIKRIKKKITSPDGDPFPVNPTYNVAFLDAREGSSDFGDDNPANRPGGIATTSTNICEVCHTYDAAQLVGVKFHGYDMSGPGDSGHYNKADCMVCHPHSQGFKPQACDSCHGYPPTATSAGGPNGLANDPHATGSTTAGAHQRHAIDLGYACTNCHDNESMPQESSVKTGFGDISIGFNTFGVTTGSYSGQSSVSYNNVLGTGGETCSNVYCHSTAQSVDGTSATPSSYSTPSWSGAVVCGSCHSDTDPATGSHTIHIGDGATCDSCHVGNNHVDHNIDVTVGTYTAGGAPGNNYGTCSTASCHTTVQGEGAVAGAAVVTPAWGTATACGECHVAVPTTGSHNEHLAASGVTCESCHTTAGDGTVMPTANHVDTNIDVANGYPAVNPIADNTYSTCSTASCHTTVQGEGAVAGTTAVTPTWGTATACGECHVAVPTTGSHNEHLSASGVTCESCHTTAGDGSVVPTANHIDTNIDVANGYPAVNPIADSTYSTCNAASCHNTVQGEGAVAGTAVVTPAWGTATACGECHVAVPTTGSHSTHLTVGGVTCADCHATAGDGSVVPTANHIDNNIDVINSYPAVNPIADSTYSSCGTNNCHGSNSPVWGTDLSANDQCTQCHGQLVAGPATDAQKAPGGTGVDTNGDSINTDAQVGAHQVHLNPTMSKAVACTACHTVPASVTAAGHIDSALPAELTFTGLALGGLDGQAAVAPANSQAGCATTYCHDGAAFKNGGAWDNGSLSPTWNDPTFVTGVAADCDNCHGYPPAGGHLANSNCISCHDNVNADNISFVDNALHVDGFVQASGGDSCTSCHGADIDGGKNGVHSSHADTATFLAGKTISGGDNGGTGWYTTVHVSGKPNFGCGECHPGEGVGHPANGLNLDLDPAGETPTAGSPKLKNTEGPTNPTFTTGSNVTCSNIYCHSDALAAGSRTYATTPNWYGGTVSGNCNDCHNNGPSTGTHANHTVGIHYDTLYDGASNLMATSGTSGSGAAHGDSATADTISCQTCHNDTVAVEYNSTNNICTTCHTGSTGSPATGAEKAIINTAGSTHVNGLADVVFADLSTFKSKAQVRDDITTVAELNTNWTRTNGYKAANSFDQGKVAAPGYAGGSCSNVSCHNGIATPTWSTGFAGNCKACHTTLP